MFNRRNLCLVWTNVKSDVSSVQCRNTGVNNYFNLVCKFIFMKTDLDILDWHTFSHVFRRVNLDWLDKWLNSCKVPVFQITRLKLKEYVNITRIVYRSGGIINCDILSIFTIWLPSNQFIGKVTSKVRLCYT